MTGLQEARRAVAALAMIAALGGAGPSSLAAVARIEPGQWQFKPLNSDAAPRMLCVADPAALMHFGRHGSSCRHIVVTDQPDLATVQYACAGAGNGSTTLRVATPRAFDLETQGIDGGAPYQESYQAHRIGACPAGAAR